MAGYIGNKSAVVSSGAERKKTFAITTTTTELTGLSYTQNFVHVFHNGIRLVDGTDYTATNGTTITLTNAAENGDEVVVVSYATFTPADAYTKAEADDRYVNAAGDTMTGGLTVDGITASSAGFMFGPASSYLYEPSADTNILRVGSDGPYVEFVDAGAGVLEMGNAGGQLALTSNGTERMRLDDYGRVTTPYQPAFVAGRADGGNSVSSGNAFALNTAFLNTGSHYNTSTYRFTAPVSGLYHFTGGVYFNSIVGGDGRFGFSTNGGYPFAVAPFVTWTNANERSVSLSASFYLNANDYVSLFNHDGVSTINYWGAHTYFTGYLIG